ncbi:metallophosphoesterase family protein [Flavimarina sp. Hel_I_48]|uniref:metallophosphoesterase family protein n=1 Tax=Flavimarina sp. Hel_I_48 TaxID=1392488 RepID=UPI0004DFA667|nr:metallophosphoesterase [Flavimarina sp. Hel_I_48]
MSDYKLSIAVVSDLHCHSSRASSRDNNTYLLSDKLRLPKSDHPVEALLELIDDEGITSDLTLCPGDFTDQHNIQGFLSGWGFALEIHNKLDSDDIVATLGNHDVDSRNNDTLFSFTTARSIGLDFPIKEETNSDEFWSKGFTFLERQSYQLLVINTCHYHQNIDSAVKGQMELSQIEKIKKYLNKNNTDKIKIACCHHHPVQHARLGLGEADFVMNGEELVRLLGDYNYDLIIHGHKHDALLREHVTESGKKITIFGSGSFSSTSNMLLTSKRNSFHFLNINKNAGDLAAMGTIKTWTYLPQKGWNFLDDPSGFSRLTGFGNQKSPKDLAKEIYDLILNDLKTEWKDLLSIKGELCFLNQNQLEEVIIELKNFNVLVTPALPSQPTQVFNLNKINNV